MKKIGIITLTRQNSLAYSVLKRIVEDLGYTPVCGEAIGADCLFFPLEELALIGYDFLGDFFKKAGLSDVDTILVSAPYSANLFVLPKVIWCLRSITSSPIILGGNEASNNYRNLMRYRFAAFANKMIDVAPDFIVRGPAENALPSLLPLLDKTAITKKWDRDFLKKLLEIRNIVFWFPERRALISTGFSSQDLSEKDIFSFVRYGEKTIAITLQRACIWAKKSRGGCLFCSIASQFGNDFHCAVSSDFFVEELSAFLRDNREVKYVDIWDDTFNISEDWTARICGYLKTVNSKVGREIIYTCFLRPKGLNENIVKKMREANIRSAFVGADALSEGLSKRLRRGCTGAELNKSIETLAKGRIQPNLSVQLFSPESVVDDVGMTATVAFSGIKNGKSTVHVHLYTFPLFGSDLYRLLEARNNLNRVPSPLLRKEDKIGFVPYFMAYDYMNYDPDVEEIKKRTYRLLDISTPFYVKTYPGDHIDGNRLKAVLREVRTWCVETKKTHTIKSLWYMIVLLLEEKGGGLRKEELLGFLSRKDATLQIPESLRRTHGDFGYRYTLSRSFDEVMSILIRNGWVKRTGKKRFRLSIEGMNKLKWMAREIEERHLNIAAYGKVKKMELFEILDDPGHSFPSSLHKP
ncbi:MAG: hypothetical protein KJ573_00900 [Proteobacteria bacterium]|nr:hypothetical protein [Pseudomonadota bacterium]MBU1902131.1 hypothetical protein [Pseudomonadota bacterium]